MVTTENTVVVEVEEKVDDLNMKIEKNRYIAVSVISILIDRKPLVMIRRVVLMALCL
jgi:hypothetical protein